LIFTLYIHNNHNLTLFFSACREGARPNHAGTVAAAANEPGFKKASKTPWTEEEDEALILVLMDHPEVQGTLLMEL
jgi:hypothetical protein